MKTKAKHRTLTLDLSCKRKGAHTHGFKITWQEPEDKAIETFNFLHRYLLTVLKAHGLMKE